MGYTPKGEAPVRILLCFPQDYAVDEAIGRDQEQSRKKKNIYWEKRA